MIKVMNINNRTENSICAKTYILFCDYFLFLFHEKSFSWSIYLMKLTFCDILSLKILMIKENILIFDKLTIYYTNNVHQWFLNNKITYSMIHISYIDFKHSSSAHIFFIKISMSSNKMCYFDKINIFFMIKNKKFIMFWRKYNINESYNNEI
jgi:hypothetical protein